MGDTVGTGIRSQADETAVICHKGDIFLLLSQKGGQYLIGEATTADQISYGGERRHPKGTGFCKTEQGFLTEKCAVLHRFSTCIYGGLYGRISVGVEHHRKALPVGKVDQAADLVRGQAILREGICFGKINETGNHDLDKIRLLLVKLVQKPPIVLDGLKATSDKAAVMARFVNGEAGTAVVDAVFWGKGSCSQTDTPSIPTVSQEGNALLSVFLQP